MKKKPLGLFSLIMMNVIAVDSLRSLSVGAEYGFALVFFYLLATLFFFIPCALVAAELATAWPTTGGVYVWVREAFGNRIGFLAIWLQWIYNVVWYPTIFSFIAGLFAYLVNPQWVNYKFYMLGMILMFFWSITLLNCMGLRVSAWISNIGALAGTIFPMIFIIILGLIWIIGPFPSQIQFSMNSFFPTLTHFSNLAFLTNIIFGLIGIEMSAVHAGDVDIPQKTYPRALLYSSLIIVSTLILASLAIAIVIPVKQLNLVSGFIEAFSIFFAAYHLEYLTPVIALLIIIGSFGGASTWIIGSARGLWVATKENQLPLWMSKVNRKNMPIGILFTQAILVTLLSLLFFVMPSVNAFYWVLSNLTAQLALIFYLLLFITAIKLRYKHPHVIRSFRIPFGNWGIKIVCGIGIITCLITLLVGFLPPSQLHVGKVFIYELILIGGIIFLCLPFFLFSKK